MISLIFAFLIQASAIEIKNYGNIYVAGTPTEQELASFKKRKGAVVLDLRAIDELGNCSEPATVAKLGLQYNRVNFAKDPKIDPQVIADIDKAVAQAHEKPILLFCKTGNRAAAWLAIHMVREEGRSLESALSVARGLGLKDDMEKAVREYLR